MSDLVTLTQAKRHLRLDPPTSPPSDDDLDLQDKIAQASALISDYVAQRILESDLGSPPTTWAAEVASWDVLTSPGTIPAVVTAAVLVQVAELWRFRGDDLPRDTPSREPGTLSPVVTSLLHRLRDPALA